MLTRVLINLVLLAVLSLICGIVLDLAISFGIAGYYRGREPYASWDAPTFQQWKAPLHHCMLLCTWVLMSLVIVLWRYVEALASINVIPCLLCCTSSTNHSIRFFALSFQPREIPFMQKRDHYMNQTALVEADTQDTPRSSQSFPHPRARVVHDHRQDMAWAFTAKPSMSQSPSDLRPLQPAPSSPIDEPSTLRTLPSIQSPIEMDVPPPNDEQHCESSSHSNQTCGAHQIYSGCRRPAHRATTGDLLLGLLYPHRESNAKSQRKTNSAKVLY